MFLSQSDDKIIGIGLCRCTAWPRPFVQIHVIGHFPKQWPTPIYKCNVFSIEIIGMLSQSRKEKGEYFN